MTVVIWLTSTFRNKIMQVSAAFASILAITHLAGAVFEAVAVLGAFAVDLLTSQVVARMDKRERNKLAEVA
jgi:hypothetical protein